MNLSRIGVPLFLLSESENLITFESENLFCS